MKFITVIFTYFLGVFIEYNLIIKPLKLNGEFLDYLFLFGILVIPGLFLFIIPISIIMDHILNIRYYTSFIIYSLSGALIAILIILVSVPIQYFSELLHLKYVYVILNGVWFSVLFYISIEIERLFRELIGKKKAIQEYISDSQKNYS